ncbi:MAG: alpha/beta hydrolase, partial [Anaerolinea sp.]|nr:alpha/beta hydrolase [Anaerolinea sp.]
VMAGEVAALIKELALDKPIILGHSMGAITTLTLAGLYPDVARAIVLEDPPPFWMIKKTDAKEPQQPNPLALWVASNKRKTKEDLFAEVRAVSPGWAEADLEPWVNAKLRYSPKIVKLVEMVDLSSMGFEELFKKISCPALLLTADLKKGAILGEKEVTPLKQWIAKIEVVQIDGAGHNIRRDQFDKYMESVKAFLAKIG